MLASLFDEDMREIIVRVSSSAAIHECRDTIFSTFRKAAWDKGF